MVTIKLHGSLAREMPQADWRLSISTLGEGIRAIDILTRQLFSRLLRTNDERGIKYQIRFGNYTLNFEAELKLQIPDGTELHILPVIAGTDSSQDKSIGMIVGGVALIILSLFIPGSWAIGPFLSSVAFNVGMALMMGGILQLISGQQDMDEVKDSSSTSFSGDINTSGQGMAVPLAYGEIMAGSHLVSMAARAVDVALI